MKKLSRARTVVLLAVFLSIAVGLFAGNGWGTLSSMGIGAIAYLCPVGMLETLATGHAPALRAVISLLCVLAAMVLLGRAFCSWVCPVPPLRRFFHPGKAAEAKKADEPAATEGRRAEQTTELCESAEEGVPGASSPVAAGTEGSRSAAAAAPVSAAADALSVAPSCSAGGSCGSCSGCGLKPVGGKRDGLHLDSRHGVLAGALLGSAIFGFPVFCLICPVGLTIAVVVGLYRALFQQDPTLSLLIFAAILLVEVVFFRKWCSKICPIGALMSLVGAKAPVRPRVNAAVCLREKGADCRACVKACPEQLDPHSRSIPECTRCGLCVEACPVGAVSFGKGRKAVPSPMPEAAPSPTVAERKELSARLSSSAAAGPFDDADLDEAPTT